MKFLVEKVRVAYASGCYSKYNLWDSYKYMLNPNDISDILEYKIYKEVRDDLKESIEEIDKNIKIYEGFQRDIHKEVELCTRAEQMGIPYEYEEKKRQLEEIRDQNMTLPVDKIKRMIEI